MSEIRIQQETSDQEQPPSTDSDGKKQAKETYEQWTHSITKEEEKPSPKNEVPRIRKVPKMMQGGINFEKYFEPRVVAIGPYHHDNPKLSAMNALKLKVAKCFFGSSQANLEDAYASLQKEVQALKECYAETSIHDYDNDLFARMMLEDGCFILNFLVHNDDHMELTSHHRAFILQDLFLLENQIPFHVLEILMPFRAQSSLSKSESQLHPSSSQDMVEPQQREPSKEAEKKSHFLLPHLESKLKAPQTPILAPPSSSSSSSDSLIDIVEDFLRKNNNVMASQLGGKRIRPGKHAHLLELLHKWLLNSKNNGETGNNCMENARCFRRKQHRGQYSFRNMKELSAVGIGVTPRKNGSLTEISFSPHRMIFGNLTLAQITIDDSTGPKFMNLMAYEMCPDVATDFEITSFVCFLDSLIDHPEDVKELRSACVMHNLLGSDEEVARLFNEIGTDLVPDSEAYKDVKEQIQEHYDSKWKCLTAQWIHEHFSTPWSGMALAAAVYALVLSSLDTFQKNDCDQLCEHLKKTMGRSGL